MENIRQQLKAVQQASHQLRTMNDDKKRALLFKLASNLRLHCQALIAENSKDLACMSVTEPNYDRLLLSAQRIEGIANDLETIATLPSPLGLILEERIRPNGLKIKKIVVPIGVVAVIYESRPNVTMDVFALCFKTGNACVLKGGKEAYHSNRFLVRLIQDSLSELAIDNSIVYLLPPEREATQTLLQATGLIDVCIPRGSQALINFVRANAKVPVIETGAGIVHNYFDISGDLAKGRLIINNAKTRRVSVCNALDTLVIHEASLDKLVALVELLSEKKVELFADERSYQVLKSQYPKELLHKAKTADFGQEFLSLKMSIKTVDSIEDAINHIRQYSSGHSEAIIAEDQQAIEYFLNQIDAAAVYVNASTAFTDGGEFGMGAEIGISTQKLHARGPMGLDALTSYKWLIFGEGQIRLNH